MRDSGIVHALLNLGDWDSVVGHPIAGGSWEGFVIESVLSCAAKTVNASFYRTTGGAEIDLILELPNNETWAIEIKRGLTPKLEKGFYFACEEIKPHKMFVVYSGSERYQITPDVWAIGLTEL